jgi:hypothetical protein
MGEEKRQDCHVNKCIATTRSKNKASTYHKKEKVQIKQMQYLSEAHNTSRIGST